MKLFGKFGNGMKKLYEKAGDLYVAEDDIWKVFNFLGEFDTYKNAYTNAAKSGLIKSVPNDLQIAKEAAKIGIAGIIKPNPTATKNETDESIETSRGKLANGLLISFAVFI